MMDYEAERSQLVDRLVSRGYIKSPRVEDAFRRTPRHLFVPEKLVESAYYDQPLPIGSGQTISAPHMVAIMTEALEVVEDDRVLEVGAGSGYQAAVLSGIVTEGSIYSVECVPELAARAGDNLKAAGVGNVFVHVADGTLGFPKQAPFDRIIVTAGAPEIPKALIEQLADGGRLLIPVGGRMMQDLLSVEKHAGKTTQKNLGGCMFVPLIGKDGW